MGEGLGGVGEQNRAATKTSIYLAGGSSIYAAWYQTEKHIFVP